MAETLEELTYDYEDEGVLVRKEIATNTEFVKMVGIKVN